MTATIMKKIKIKRRRIWKTRIRPACTLSDSLEC